MNSRGAHRVLIAAIAGLVWAGSAWAASIGVQFTGAGGVALAPGQTAGMVAQSNYNVASGTSASGLALKDNSGVSTTASLAFSTNESGYTTTVTSPVTFDEILNHGILNGTAGVNPTIAITGIPYPVYDLIVYTLNNEPRSQRVIATTAAGSTSFTVRSPNGGASGYQDSNAGTPYSYIPGTTNSQTPVPDSDYVRFINLTGDVTLTADAQVATFPANTNNNAFINGFQIVEVTGNRLYGLSGVGTGGTLYTIDTSTGAATAVAQLSGPPVIFKTIGGLDFLGGVLYATGVYAGSPTYNLGSINTSTGAFTSITAQDQANWHGLAGNESAGVLYTVGTDSLPFTLKSVTPAGAITDIGPTGSVGGEGLAYDNVHGILYATYLDRIYTLDTATGAPTLVGSTGFSPGTAGLTYDPSLDILYLNDPDTNSLYRVSPITAQATFVGSNQVSASIDALPEPSGVYAMCLGALLIGLLAARTKKRMSA